MIVWAMAQRYAWATPDRIARLSYPQLHVLLQDEYTPPRRPGEPELIWLPAAEALVFCEQQRAKNNG